MQNGAKTSLLLVECLCYVVFDVFLYVVVRCWLLRFSVDSSSVVVLCLKICVLLGWCRRLCFLMFCFVVVCFCDLVLVVVFVVVLCRVLCPCVFVGVRCCVVLVVFGVVVFAFDLFVGVGCRVRFAVLCLLCVYVCLQLAFVCCSCFVLWLC